MSRGVKVNIIRISPYSGRPLMWHVALSCGHVRIESNSFRWQLHSLCIDRLWARARLKENLPLKALPMVYCRKCLRGEAPDFKLLQLGDWGRLPEPVKSVVTAYWRGEGG